MFVLKEDYTEPYTDGSGRFKTVFKRGDSISWETAYALGLVTTKTEPKATEDKPARTQKEETQAKN
jgi:hypothetical protein